MENRTEIGKAIKNKLADLDKNPSDFAWSKIEKDLNQKRHKRILTWAIPSLIAVIFFSALFYFNTNLQEVTPKKSSQEIQPKKKTNTETNASKANQKPILLKTEPDQTTTISKTKSVKLIKESSKLVTTTDEYEEYEVVKKYKVVVKKQQIKTAPIKLGASKKPLKASLSKNAKTSAKHKTAKNTLNKKVKPDHLSQNKKTETKWPVNYTPEKIVLDTLKNNKIALKTDQIQKDTIANIDSLSIKKTTAPKREYKKTVYNTKPEENRPDFSIHAFYGPAISGSLNGLSMISPTMDNLPKSHPITSHYGIYVKTMYDRIGFRTGFSKINLKTTTLLDQNLITDFENINLKPEVNIKETFGTSNDVELLQKLSYYEIPLEFNYALKKDESKFEVDAFTGFSFLFLDKNQLFLKSEKVSMQEVGEAKNISGLNISYDLGIGITYKLTDKIGLDINPLFKYYLNTFKENGEAKPYSLSLQTGINYKF
ncbi:hypothetical protein RB619_06960 [Flavobacterium sp. LHD-80]|uniref:hypothetical protein n=1 Tax=Flavobacterium sp. LHD-80 TaxID=3071411 RepID=UPI0027E1CEDD|nr:hypothetical protein [Flavobacterium sp. LHD-80]MDQ6470375.1 hypothetical protein [Flavobacterium sp. LHD-80]